MMTLAGVVVVLFGLALVALAAAMVFARARAERFLMGFASSAATHVLEQALRLAAGAALVVFAPEMRFPALFNVFGWVIVATAIGLLLLPWRVHHRFGQWAIPLAIRQIKLYALAVFALGAFILYAAVSRWPPGP